MNKLWQIAYKMKKVCGGRFARIFELLNYIIYSNHIPADVQIGENTRFEHHGLGVVVHSKVTIGSNCRIFQNVTIGAK